MEQEQPPPPRYKLYYWPEFPGRGELMRLIFAETNTPFDDVFRDLSFDAAKEFCYGSKRFFAVPAIEDTENENLCLSQSCVIMRYLAERCGGGRLYPSDKNNGYKAEVLMQDAADMLAEGCNAWHAVDYNKGYSEQAEATKPFIEYFVTSRLPKWLNRFNTVLENNNANNSELQELYFVGDSLPYVDLAIFQVTRFIGQIYHIGQMYMIRVQAACMVSVV
jgi:glutathione S-transferase